jgi:biotin operon repressor
VHEEPNRSPGEHDRRAERAVVLLLLESDDGGGWTPSRIGAELELSEEALGELLEGLREEGLLSLQEGRFRVSPALRCLDSLGVLAI